MTTTRNHPLRSRLRRSVATGLATILTATLGFAAGLPAAADDLDDQLALTEAQQAATAAAQSDLEGQLEGTETALAQAYYELEGIRGAIPVAEAQLQAAEDELAGLVRAAEIIAQQLADAQAEEQRITDQIAVNTARAEEIQVAIGRMAREAYRGDMAVSSLSAILDATSTEDFVEQSALSATALRTQTQALRELDQINAMNRNQQVRLVAVREQITGLKAEADAKVAEAEIVRQRAADRRAELGVLLAQAEEKAAYIESQREQMIAQQAEYEAQQAALATTLAQIVDEQRRRAAAAGTSPDLAGSKPLGYPTPPPIHVTSSYGIRFHPILHIWRMHAGTDFRAYCGNPIIAAADGTVQWAQYLGGYGNQVMINHGALDNQSVMTSYNHLSSFAVSKGQSVSRGQVVGYSGTTGTSLACHLHFEVYIDGATVNPIDWVG